MEARREAASASLLDVATLSPGMQVDDCEIRSTARIAGFHRHDALIVLSSDFEFGDWSRVLLALEFTVIAGVFVVIAEGDTRVMALRMAFEDAAILLQLAAIESDHLCGVISRFVFRNNQLQAKGLSQYAKVERVVVLLHFGPSAGIQRDSGFAGIGILSDVQVSHRTANVK